MHEALRHRVETCLSALLPLLVKQATGPSPESSGEEKGFLLPVGGAVQPPCKGRGYEDGWRSRGIFAIS